MKVLLRAKSLNKFVLTSTLFVFVSFIFLISIFLYISLNEYIKKEAVKKAESAAMLTVSYVEKQFERALLNARFLSFLLETTKAQSNPSRDDVIKILKNIVENNSEFLGAWVVFEPDAFDARDYEYINSPGADKDGRFVPYYNSIDGYHLESCYGYDDPSSFSDWYNIPKRTGLETIVDPFEYTIKNETVLLISYSVPIFYNNTFIGVAGVDISNIQLKNFVSGLNSVNDSKVFILSSTGKFMVHPDDTVHGKNFESFLSFRNTDEKKILAAMHSGKLNSFFDYSYFESSITLNIIVPIKITKYASSITLFMTMNTDKLFYQSNKILNFVLMVLLVSIIFSITFIFILSNRITSPIIELAEKVRAFGRGDFDISFESGRNDEIALISKELDKMSKALIQKMEEINQKNDLLNDKNQELASSYRSLQSKEMELRTLYETISKNKNILDEKNQELEKLNIRLNELLRLETMSKERFMGFLNVTGEFSDILLLSDSQIIRRLMINTSSMLKNDYSISILFDEDLNIKDISTVGPKALNIDFINFTVKEIDIFDSVTKITPDEILASSKYGYMKKLLKDHTSNVSDIIACPIKNGGKSFGQFYFFFFNRIFFSPEDIKIITSFQKITELLLKIKIYADRINNAYTNFAHKLALIAENYDEDTGFHINRVGKIAGFLALKYGLPKETVRQIEKFGPLHDIGKIFIPKELLMKKSKLSEQEYEVMKNHTLYAKNILQDDDYFTVALNIALYHHEKYDGSGYNSGLSGESIPIEAQLVSITDVYDALRSKRPYKDAMSHIHAVEILKNGDSRTKPTDFNPKILELFIKYEREIGRIYDIFS